MLDAPFYSRSAVETILDGQKTTGVFEALDLHRFRNPMILAMLAMRVPRRKRWTFK
jgi:carotenoid 1,2-hydratase